MPLVETPCCGMIVEAATFARGCPACGQCLKCGRMRTPRPELCDRCGVPFCPCCARCPGCGAYRFGDVPACECGYEPSAEDVAAIADAFRLPADRTKTAWAQKDHQTHRPTSWASIATVIAGVVAVAWLLAMLVLRN